MNWLHTWAGVAIGALLFAVFWMGTLSVFDKEIDRWMMPATRLAMPADGASFDGLRQQLPAEVRNSPFWSALLPTDREPAFRVGYRAATGEFRIRHADPANGRLLPDQGSWAGSRFIYPFHYSLHIGFASLGYWIVGLAGMVMLVLCVSGVVIHRQIFVDFFTLRSDRAPRRLVLDLHNVLGVLGLPFHFVISLSGLIIFFYVYFPSVADLAYAGDRQTQYREMFAIGGYTRAKAGQPSAASASLDTIVVDASRRWAGGAPSLIRLFNDGDANAYMEVRRAFEAEVPLNRDLAIFDVATGSLLYDFTTGPVHDVQLFISGLHFIQFRHWTLRWVYFALGMTGCAMIATGFLFWIESRRKRHAQLGLKGVPIVHGLTVGSVSGIIIATLCFFVVNRLLPLGASFLGYERYALEIWTFYLVWLASFAHAWLRPSRAWIEQCWTIAALSVAAVALNWITTGDHLVHSLAHRHLWPVAGMDAMMLVAAVAAFATARMLARKRSAASTPAPARISHEA